MEAPGIETDLWQIESTMEHVSGTIRTDGDPADVSDRASKCPIVRGVVTESSEGYELSDVVETALAKALVLAAEARRWDVVSPSPYQGDGADPEAGPRGARVARKLGCIPRVACALLRCAEVCSRAGILRLPRHRDSRAFARDYSCTLHGALSERSATVGDPPRDAIRRDRGHGTSRRFPYRARRAFSRA